MFIYASVPSGFASFPDAKNPRQHDTKRCSLLIAGKSPSQMEMMKVNILKGTACWVCPYFNFSSSVHIWLSMIDIMQCQISASYSNFQVTLDEYLTHKTTQVIITRSNVCMIQPK